MINQIYIILGSNIDKERNLPAAIDLLRGLCRVVAVSRVYETHPIGSADAPAFLNAAALVETEMSAAEFRDRILATVEHRLGRIRTADRNAPRTIDADIAMVNREVFELDSEHHIPDPDILRHQHVAVPLADLSPDLVHPESGEKLQEIAIRLSSRALDLGEPEIIWKKEFDFDGKTAKRKPD